MNGLNISHISSIASLSHRDVVSRADSTLRPLLAPAAWVRSATRCGFSAELAFKEVGVDLVSAFKASPVVTATEMLQLMSVCCVQSGPMRPFPLELGRVCTFDNLPAIETFITTSPTMRHALRALDWVSEFLPMISAKLVERGEITQLVVAARPLYVASEAAQAYVETVMTSFYNFVGTLSSNLPQAREYVQVCFTHDEFGRGDLYRRYFQSPIRFRQAFSGFEVPSVLLDLPMTGAVPELNRLAESAVRGYLARLVPHSSMSEQVERLLLDRPAMLGQGVELVAETLGLHLRTLQRRLHEEGVRYSHLQDRVWLALAARWLEEEDTDIDILGLRLGYTSGASFTRAFKRLAGVAPRQFRDMSRPSRNAAV